MKILYCLFDSPLEYHLPYCSSYSTDSILHELDERDPEEKDSYS